MSVEIDGVNNIIKADTISEVTSANGVTIDGLTIKDGNIISDVVLGGTTPTLTIGDGGAEDAKILFDGNAQNFHIGLDDSGDKLTIGLGNALGTYPGFTMDENTNVVFPDNSVTIVSSGNGDNLTLTSTDADANVGPNLNFYRNSGSPADNDDLGKIVFNGRNDNSQDVVYAQIRSTIVDASDGTEDGLVKHDVSLGGTAYQHLSMGNGSIVFNEESQDIDFRVESNGNTHMIFVDANSDHVNIGQAGDSEHTLNVNGNGFFTTADNTDTLTLESTDADANSGPVLCLHRNSGSPADADLIGRIDFSGESDLGSEQNYAVIKTFADDVSHGSESGQFSLFTRVAGSEIERMSCGAAATVFNDGSANLDFRVESNGNTHALFVDGGSDFVGIGTSDSNSSVCNIAGATASNTILTIDSTSASYSGDGIQRILCARANTTGYEFMRAMSGGTADNEFILRGDGNAFADNAWNASGADYAEYFEWKDGNSSSEDRRGYSVVLDGNQIVKATDSDDASKIIGIISGNPAMVGDGAYTKWNDKYQKDDFGSYLRDEDGYRILNTDYDETKDYVPREDRKEWDTVGLMGKLRLKKGEPTGTNWIKMRDISDTVEEWLVR